MRKILKEFRHDKVLLVYKCGSYAFGTYGENSDNDYVVVLRDFRGLTHRNDEETHSEYFIFGLLFWKDKMEYDEDLAEYYLAFNDEILSFPESIVYIDDEIKPLVEQYVSEFPSKIRNWLKAVVAYFTRFVMLGDMEKRFYHLVRIKHIVERYKKTGRLSLELSPEVSKWITDYKSATDKEVYRKDIHDALNYLKKEVEVTE